MDTQQPLNAAGQEFRQQLAAAFEAAKKRQAAAQGPTIHVSGVGQIFSSAYEQFRNSAVDDQEHLLLQRAIRRFYGRNLSLQGGGVTTDDIGEELIIELTQAGYIKNDTQPTSTATRIDAMVTRYLGLYADLINNNVGKDKAAEWVMQMLSVETEKLIQPEHLLPVYAQFAYRHYLSILKRKSFVGDDTADAQSFELSLYVAVHKALLKADIASLRYDMVQLYEQSVDSIEAYIKLNQTIDELYQAPLTEKLTRHINKYGAPLRVLKSLVETNAKTPEILLKKSSFLSAYDAQVNQEYKEAKARVNRGVVKSLIFLFLTKALIGLTIEIPYDIYMTGGILMVPLVINLLFPVLYMASLRLTLKMPGKVNTDALKDYMAKTLYDHEGKPLLPSRRPGGYSKGFTIAYAVMFILVFGFVINRLMSLNFNIVQGLIFFIFLSTASFLGFRLLRMVREIELVTTKPSIVMIIRDFFYTPFVFLGQWLSEKYAKVNIVMLVLDTVIELPTKTLLRLIRQWSSFMNDKKDEI